MEPASQLPLPRAQRGEIRGWAILAVGSLAIAGALALLLALSRTPKVQDWLPWGPTFFYRALITHVVLSFQVWFLAALGALSALVAGGGRGAWLGRPALAAAAAGTLLLLVPALADRGEPSLNNYVPVLVHPLFYAGLALLAVGVALATVRLLPRIARRDLSDASFGIICAGLMYLAACACFLIAWRLIPSATDSALLNERLFWGGGHVLQFVNTALLMAAWQMLSEKEFGRPPLPPVLARATFVALLLFAMAAPLLYTRHNVLSLEHRRVFTELLWYGLPLPPAVMGAGVFLRLWRGPRDWRSPVFLSLALSLTVFALGGLAGFFLGVADTRTPSHYHAMIGGVNLGLMGLFLTVFLPALGRAPRRGKALRWQFHLYGWGQLLHALGFFGAGAAGVPRKAEGLDQGLDTLWKKVSMAGVGLGGAIAVIGGVMFVWMVLARLLPREDADERV